ncbi:MAG: hypothetical protein PVG52_06390, partial [Desulfobacterales bacterium]
DNVVKRTGSIYAGFTWHKFSLAVLRFRVDLFIYIWTLYIKAEEVNTATYNLEKNYYRVDKKTTS